MHTAWGSQGRVYWPLSASHPFLSHSWASTEMEMVTWTDRPTETEKSCQRESQVATQGEEKEGMLRPGQLLCPVLLLPSCRRRLGWVTPEQRQGLDPLWTPEPKPPLPLPTLLAS